MREEIINILLNSQRNYNNYSLRKLREIEKYFMFNKIEDEDIKRLGELINEEAKNKDREYSIRIINLNDEEIYLFLSSSKALRNIEFGKKKGKTVKEYKHTSFYPLIMYALGFEDISYFDRDDILTVAGGFPIYEEHKLKYIVEISGFKNGEDFAVFINALGKFLNKEVPMFDEYIV